MSTASPSLPAWVSEAARRPVAFAQVREDPRIDRLIAEDCGQDLDIIQIASGGCTAALLATLSCVATLHLVDPNPAQLALTRLKLWLLNSPTDLRLAALGHAEIASDERGVVLRGALADLALPENSFGPLADIAVSGPDHAGRYELVFAALRQHLAPSAGAIAALLALDDPAEQHGRVTPGSALGDALDQALDEVMTLSHLVHLFGDSATRNAVVPFSRHFASRLRHALATLPALTNPYLWQMLAGAYPPGNAADWFSRPKPQRLPDITWSGTTMDAALAGCSGRFHVVHLSNILDWLSPAEATRTLALAWQALRSGGRVVIRQLNSHLIIPDLAPRFIWMTDAAVEFHRRDRSFFYRGLLVGRKP